jgi:hypothetical protein
VLAIVLAVVRATEKTRNKVNLTAVAMVVSGLVEKERSKLVAYIVEIGGD